MLADAKGERGHQLLTEARSLVARGRVEAKAKVSLRPNMHELEAKVVDDQCRVALAELESLHQRLRGQQHVAEDLQHTLGIAEADGQAKGWITKRSRRPAQESVPRVGVHGGVQVADHAVIDAGFEQPRILIKAPLPELREDASYYQD